MLSALQRAVLSECVSRRGEVPRAVFRRWVRGKPKHREKILTRSLERLIDRGLLTGYGVRTQEKWFVQSVRLTPAGRRAFASWQQSRQQKFPWEKYARSSP
ncbi:MAG: hypothetical protein HYV42_03030 [Candidatus Magasanikbacteria bacterium]|nr:hypothetical protein [Candidatus Magasanikbacteria bacterium]